MKKLIILAAVTAGLAACGKDTSQSANAAASASVSPATPAQASARPRVVVAAASYAVERSLEHRLQLAADQLAEDQQHKGSAPVTDGISTELAKTMGVTPGAVVKVKGLTVNQVIPPKTDTNAASSTVDVDASFTLAVNGQPVAKRMRLTLTQGETPQILGVTKLLSFRTHYIAPTAPATSPNP